MRPSGDHPNNCIIENGQKTGKSPGDLRRLPVTQSPVKDHQLTLLGKTLIIIIIIIIIFFQMEMNDKIQKENFRITRKLLETKLPYRNLMKGINTWVVLLVRYSGTFSKST